MAKKRGTSAHSSAGKPKAGMGRMAKAKKKNEERTMRKVLRAGMVRRAKKKK